MVAIFFASGFFFFIPFIIQKFLLKRKRAFEITKNVLNALSSGIFFGIITLDLWPAALEEFAEELEAHQIVIKFPISELCIAIGFFIIFIIEEFQDYFGMFTSF